MHGLEEIAESVQADFEARNRARDAALASARTLVRAASHAIRAVHRSETEAAIEKLAEAGRLAAALTADLMQYPDIYHAGYTQDALKEYAEAHLVFALVSGARLPSPADLGIPSHTYINGLAEAATELRRRCLDLMRDGLPDAAEPMLVAMDDIFSILVTMDFPDAITGGLRRQTDVVRSVLERTRGDLTVSLRQRHLEERLRALEARLDGAG